MRRLLRFMDFPSDIPCMDHRETSLRRGKGQVQSVVQNTEAFAFTDALLGEGVQYETAGSLMGGRKVWLLARLPREFIIAGERISPYLVFSNTHDGSGAVRVAVTPIRVCCNNTLNLALATAQRSLDSPHRFS